MSDQNSISDDQYNGIRVITTDDGSSSLFVPDLNETYHSFHGAIQESLHVFVKNGLEHYILQNQVKRVKVFEVGFGTGLNALLSYQYAEQKQIFVDYYTIEAYPIEMDLVERINYPEKLDLANARSVFDEMHRSESSTTVPFGRFFRQTKYHGDLRSFHSRPLDIDVIYFDAFAPNKQQDLWTIEIFKKLHRYQSSSGLLVTYSAQGQFRRDLKSAGYTEIKKMPGPPGKKEMTLANT